MKHKKIAYHEQQEVKPRHAHCSFCGGKGLDMRAEVVTDQLGKKYRVPVTHEQCKKSIFFLSLFQLN
jgi:hypothetical protein